MAGQEIKMSINDIHLFIHLEIAFLIEFCLAGMCN
jgi:hypothetical protein